MTNRRPKPRTRKDLAIDEIYARIPSMKSCSGACASACGPIVMFEGEWKRVKAAKGDRVPRYERGSLRCPMLSPTGACTVYTVRPYICRLWGTTPTLECPEGCQPERWLSRQEAHEIFEQLQAVAGPKMNGPVGVVDDIWAAFALEAREERAERVEAIRQAKQRGDL